MNSSDHPQIPLRISVILEWENAKLSEIERARRMLRVMKTDFEQLTATKGVLNGGQNELWVMYDREETNPEAIRSILEAELGDDQELLEIQLVATTGGQKQYYQLKNQGARLSSGNLLVMIDSDVVPEPGWFTAMITPFRDADVHVVTGNCYVENDRFYSRAFALFWFFPLREEPGQWYEVDDIFGNSIAIRRETFEKHPFPELTPGIARGSCSALAMELMEADYRIWRTTSAQVIHPPPQAFFRKSLSNGRDRALRQRDLNPSRLTGFGASVRWLAGHTWSSGKRIFNGFRSVGLSVPGAFAAFGLAMVYGLFSWAGELSTVVAPRYMASQLNEF